MSAFWIDPLSIRFKISPHDDLRGVAAGEWDVERRFSLETTVKYRSIVQRYRDGARWEETDLFTDAYRRRFEAGESVRGERTFEQLLNQYYTRVDDMFFALRREGFSHRHSLPKLLIGRNGDVFIGNQGNHRLAMSHVLELRRIAGEIICRHKLA